MATGGHLVTFGIEAAAPETGYGYIERAEAIQSGYHVARFVEKPDLEQAQKYVDSGQYYWNSGMFVFQSQQFLTALKMHAPLIAQFTEAAWQDRRVDQSFIRPNPKAFEDCPRGVGGLCRDGSCQGRCGRAFVSRLERHWILAIALDG